MTEKKDTELINQYLKGDEKSLEILIRRYLKSIYSLAYRYAGNSEDAQDITQDVFIKVWRNLKKFDKNKSFRAWIFSIAKHTSLDWLKKKKAVPFSNFENEEGKNVFAKMLVDPVPLPDKIFEQIGVAQLLKSVIEKLLPKYRLVLSLYYNDNLNFREIAERLKEPLDTVKSRHRRALIMLKKLFKS